MLARFSPTILRAMTSGWLGTVTVSPMVTIQPGPSGSRLTRRGRSSLMRTIAAPSAPRSSTALRIARPESAASAARSILAVLSNTSHSVSARWKTAAGVGDRERKFGAQNVARLLQLDHDGRVRIGRRPLAFDRGRVWQRSFGASGAASFGAARSRPAGAAAAIGAVVILRFRRRRRRRFSATFAGGGTAAGATDGAAAAFGGCSVAAASCAGTVSGAAIAGTAAGFGGRRRCAAGLGLAPSWPTSTTMLRSSRNVRTCGVPLSAKVTATESSSTSASIDSSVGGNAALASARSHLIG